MKLHRQIESEPADASCYRRCVRRDAEHHMRGACAPQSGMSLIEILVYLALVLMFSAAAMTAFYFCWDDTRTLMSATDDVSAALHAGEIWRADVRAASGIITVQTIPSGEVLKIPEGKNDVLYRFDSGQLRRQVASENFQLLLPRVKASDMEPETRHDVTAWRWELELARRPNNIHVPLLFTFEAAQKPQ